MTTTIHDDATAAERVLLGRLMTEHEPHELLPTDLVHPLHGQILATIEGIAANGQTPDLVTVAASMPDSEDYQRLGGRKYLAQLATVADASIAPLRDLTSVILGFAAKRKLAAIATDMLGKAAERDSEPADLVGKAMEQLADIRSATVDTRLPMSMLAGQIMDDLVADVAAIPTGLPSLDTVLEGGLYPGMMIAFDGRMKAGKTVMLGTIARNVAAQGVPTAYLALEMGAKYISRRLIAADLGINTVRFQRRDMPDLYERMRRYRPNDALVFENKPNLSFDRLRPLVARLCRYHGVKVIVLDYWQLVTGQRKGQSKTDHLDEVAQWLAGAAKEYDCAIVTAAQRNREGETRGGDGLKAACDVYFQQHKVETLAGGSPREHVWLEMSESRYTAIRNVGDETSQALYISHIGPVIEEYGS